MADNKLLSVVVSLRCKKTWDETRTSAEELVLRMNIIKQPRIHLDPNDLLLLVARTGFGFEQCCTALYRTFDYSPLSGLSRICSGTSRQAEKMNPERENWSRHFGGHAVESIMQDQLSKSL